MRQPNFTFCKIVAVASIGIVALVIYLSSSFCYSGKKISQTLANTPQDAKTAKCVGAAEATIQAMEDFCNSDLFRQIVVSNSEIKQADCLRVGYIKTLKARTEPRYVRECAGIHEPIEPDIGSKPNIQIP